MLFLEIVKPGLLSSFQDLGRKGLSYYAIPNSGVMDRNAAQIALLLLDKGHEEPVLECTSLAPTIRFHAATRIAITGADFSWKLNGTYVGVNNVLEIKSGDLLEGGFAKDKLRGYIGFQGELILSSVYGSKSTLLSAAFGGFAGRSLRKGDKIFWQDQTKLEKDVKHFFLYPGPEFNLLEQESRSRLCSQKYTISTDSNRMGLRLSGVPLKAVSYQLSYSAPLLPGFIQLPPSGQPIIVLQDGQTTGGYIRIAYIREVQLSKLNQIPLGQQLSFGLFS